MLIELEQKYREDLQPLDICYRWNSGKSLEWSDLPVFQISDYTIAFIKGDHTSNIIRDHTSIHLTEFTLFAETCVDKVCLVNSRLVFEREIIIGFSNEEDAVMFKLRWT